MVSRSSPQVRPSRRAAGRVAALFARTGLPRGGHALIEAVCDSRWERQVRDAYAELAGGHVYGKIVLSTEIAALHRRIGRTAVGVRGVIAAE